MVPDRDIAWHAGNWAYNESSIGIEHAGFTNVTHFPDAEYRGSAKLAAWIADTFLITPDRSHVIGHSQVPDPNHPGEWGGVDHHTDPGRTWDWPRYMAYLRADAQDTPQQVVDNADPTGVRYDPAVWHVASAQPGRYGRTLPGRDAPERRQPGQVPAGGACQRPLRPRDALAVRRRLGPGRDRRCDEPWHRARRPSTSPAAAASSGTWAATTCPPATPGGSQVSSASRARGTIVADAFRLVEQSDPSPPTAPVVTAARGRDRDRPELDEGPRQHRRRRLPRRCRLGAALSGHGPHAGGHRPCVRRRPHRLGACARHGVEPLAEASAAGAHNGLPGRSARADRDAAAACRCARLVGAGGRALLRGVLQRAPDHDDARAGLHRVGACAARRRTRSRCRASTRAAAYRRRRATTLDDARLLSRPAPAHERWSTL